LSRGGSTAGQRVARRATLLNVSAGWCGHLDVLVACMTGNGPGPFWDDWRRLRAEYDRWLPA
jgi:hypothetical protein